ncbi:MAG TPA: shikimate kinase [Terriglobales bacterium]|nr:shikimate kinase [Terriglobales bacterium]
MTTTVLLVGFMGAGKTTVGRELARALNWSFYDLDALIEGRAGRTVPAIFAEQGEAAFRKLEFQSIRELLEALEDEPAVVALGGGAFAQESIRQLIRDHSAPVVFLDVALDEALRRCASASGNRPLLNEDGERIRLLYEQRLPFYRTAGVQMPTDGKSPIEVVEEIRRILQLTPREEEA